MVLLLERKSLRREMIAINMITLGVTLLLVSGALVIHEYEVSRSAILGQITEQARLIGRVSAPALRANDRTLPEQLVDRRAQEPTGRHARRDLHRQRRSVHDHSRALQDRRRDLIEMQRRLCDELARAPGRTSSTSTGFERCASGPCSGVDVGSCRELSSSVGVCQLEQRHLPKKLVMSNQNSRSILSIRSSRLLWWAAAAKVLLACQSGFSHADFSSSQSASDNAVMA